MPLRVEELIPSAYGCGAEAPTANGVIPFQPHPSRGNGLRGAHYYTGGLARTAFGFHHRAEAVHHAQTIERAHGLT